MRWLMIGAAIATAVFLWHEPAWPASPGPCEHPVDELRCRLAVAEREIAAARADAITMEVRMRMREQELLALESKAKWLSGVIWPHIDQPQKP